MISSDKFIDNEARLFQQAEELIDKSIADMGQDSHVEYATSIERDTSSANKWLKKVFCKLFSG
jgi:hypothetical protein